MATAAPTRRLARGAVALAFAGPAVLLGGVAWADPTPTPADDTATEAPVVQPSVGTWIIGGTLLEGTAAQPAKPVTKPAAKPPAVAPTAPDGATALPFTGNHVDALLPAGITLLVGGLALTLVARPRRVLA